MKRFTTFFGLCLLTLAALYMTRIPADAQAPTSMPSVWLQPTTPGVFQNGNLNINGTLRAGILQGNGSQLQNLGGHNITSGRILLDLSYQGATITGVNHNTVGACIGLSGFVPEGGIGVEGVSGGTNGTGVSGWAGATSGVNSGGDFVSSSTSGTGVKGTAAAETGTNYGVYGQSYGTSGYGVFGANYATTGTTFGVYGRSSATSGRGVYGLADGTNGGTHYGVLGQSNSSTGAGAVGYDTATTGVAYGVYGATDSTSGRGVYGLATAISGTNYGVFGEANLAASGFAVYALGDMGASGLKPFRIDNPLDPENSYLMHYATESPAPQNSYSGNVVTDGNGYAWVELPNYFEEINANYKYQLTVIGKSFAQAIISQEISHNRFQVRSSSPNIKVSWRVEANRNDPYVRNRKPSDVVEKSDEEKGTYQHPELYGMPPERGLTYTKDNARVLPKHK